MPEEDHILKVGAAEAGQKLLSLLQRRLCLPSALLHRWIRTGQIRLNGGRAKAFARVAENDAVRLPPFASAMDAAARARASARTPSSVGRAASPESPVVPPLPPLIHADADIIVFNKPPGLPVHAGTGHESDSLAARLAAHYAGTPFLPTPAHRLDKNTSGLLLAGASYNGLRALQDALRAGTLIKEYLGWVEGIWPYAAPRLLRHRLAKRYSGSYEKVHAGQGKEAACVAACLRTLKGRSLLHIRLLTGRTHQIRAQLTAEGHPLCGDVKYGGQGGRPVRLHALRLILPDGREFVVPPPWSGADALGDDAPPPPLETPDIRP